MPKTNFSARLAGAAFALALGPCATAPAQAAVMKATFTGTVIAGEDLTGTFGSTVFLGGFTYEQVVIYDTGLGLSDSSTPLSDERVGGLFNGAANPILDSWFTLQGHSEHFVSPYLGGVGREADGFVFVTAPPQVLGPYEAVEQIVHFTSQTPFSLDTPFTASEDPCKGLCGLFVKGPWTDKGLGGDVDFAFTLETDTVTVERFDAVPEPAAWSLALAGFGLLGTALRARRRRPETAA